RGTRKYCYLSMVCTREKGRVAGCAREAGTLAAALAVARVRVRPGTAGGVIDAASRTAGRHCRTAVHVPDAPEEAKVGLRHRSSGRVADRRRGVRWADDHSRDAEGVGPDSRCRGGERRVGAGGEAEGTAVSAVRASRLTFPERWYERDLQRRRSDGPGIGDDRLPVGTFVARVVVGRASRPGSVAIHDVDLCIAVVRTARKVDPRKGDLRAVG